MLRFGAHDEHTHLPHRRQWCRRRKQVNLLVHRSQPLTAESAHGCHSLKRAMRLPTWRPSGLCLCWAWRHRVQIGSAVLRAERLWLGLSGAPGLELAAVQFRPLRLVPILSACSSRGNVVDVKKSSQTGVATKLEHDELLLGQVVHGQRPHKTEVNAKAAVQTSALGAYGRDEWRGRLVWCANRA